MMIGRTDDASAEPATALPDVKAAATRVSGPELPRPFLWLADGVCIVTAFHAAYRLAPRIKAVALNPQSVLAPWVSYLAPAQGGEYRSLDEVAWVLLVMWAVTALSLQGMGGYRPLLQQSRARVVGSTFAAPFVGLSIVALVLFALRSASWSRLFIFLFTALTAGTLCAYRSSVRWYRARRAASGVYAKSIAFVGSPASVKWLRLFFEKMTSPADYRAVGWFSISDSTAPAFAAGAREPLPCLGPVERLGDVLVNRPIHEVVAIQSTAASEWLRELIEVCDYFRVTLRIIPEALLTGRLRDLQLRYHSDSLRLPEVVLRPHNVGSDALFIKRAIDIVVSATLLVLLMPLFILIAIAIKLTTPALPVLYPWRVIGYNGRPFTGYKFATMGADADARKADLMHLNEMTGPVFKIKDDPRVTPLGRFLRKYSLNELPQLWSVLRGDMSLVGPRPAGPHELARYELWHKRKLCIQPGITCLWQVRGRNSISNFDDWVRMDLEYIDTWSLWLDVKILARTVWTVVAGTGS
jgi:exopolysaccharide biosynthesis polyprenyl glycosylphosphotransferase